MITCSNKKQYPQFPYPVTSTAIPTFLQIHLHASSSLSIFFKLMQSLDLAISLHLEPAVKITSGFLPFSDLSLEETLLWEGLLKGQITSGYSSFWRGSTVFSVCLAFLGWLCHCIKTARGHYFSATLDQREEIFILLGFICWRVISYRLVKE